MAIETVGIIGAGTMGAGIAVTTAQAGLRTILIDTNERATHKAIEDARTFFARAVSKNRMSDTDAAAAGGRLEAATALRALEGCDLVIEAVFEDFDLKVRLFRELDPILSSEALVATNTSCLRVTDLATAIGAPERFLGLHYFSPAQINPIVEVVSGAVSAPAAIEAAMAFCARTGKTTIRCKDAYGFAINRFFCPYTNEAAHVLGEGLANAASIDEVAKDALGVAAGPFFVMNIIKPRTNIHAIRNLGPLGSFYAPARAMIEHGDADRSFELGEPTDLAAPLRKTIADRILCGVFLPVLEELDEEVASAADIDRGAREALRFGKPPCALMDSLGRAEVTRIVAPALERHGLARPASLGRVGRLVG